MNKTNNGRDHLISVLIGKDKLMVPCLLILSCIKYHILLYILQLYYEYICTGLKAQDR